MTLLYQENDDDRTPEFTIEKLKTIQTPKAAGESNSLVEDSETVCNGKMVDINMDVSTIGEGETVGLEGSRSVL